MARVLVLAAGARGKQGAFVRRTLAGMRSVYEAANLIDAYLVKHALEAAGIPCYVRGESLTGGIGEIGVFGLVGVMVPEAAWPQASAVVGALELGAGPQAAPDASQDDLPGLLPA